MKKNLIILSILIFVIILAAFAASAMLNKDEVLSHLSRNSTTPTPTHTQYVSETIVPTSEPTPEPTATPEPMPQYTNIVVGFAGDMIAHERLIANGFTYDMGTRTIDYNHIFKYITPALEYPDFMIANLESPIAGEDMGFTQPATLTFNFPDEIADAILNSGIDMVLNGNNHASDKNPEGMYRTLDLLDSVGLLHTGAWRTDEERAIPTIIEVEGIKIGIVNPTFSLNGREVYIKEDILDHFVCFLDKDQVEKEMNLCRENGAELVIVTPHMGDEYQQYTREWIRNYGRAYVALGADLVVGHHPHVLQGTELIQSTADDGTENEALCFWSIGNFMHNQTTLFRDFDRDVRETGIILYVNIRKDNYTGEVEIESLEYLPIWMLRRADLNPRLYAILPAGQDIDFNSAPYNEMPLIDRNFKSLAHAWELALQQVGTKYATPLSAMPVRDELKKKIIESPDVK